jgi:hypothetical protein
MTVNSRIFSVLTLNTIEYGPPTLNIKPHLDPLTSVNIKDLHIIMSVSGRHCSGAAANFFSVDSRTPH